MKGVLFLGNRSLKLADFPDPSAGPREVVLEIKASGMCGSDLHIYRASGQRRHSAIMPHLPSSRAMNRVELSPKSGWASARRRQRSARE
jgi:NADPH:quinone reductase-like Zn-dependent oxidoreductase